MNEVKEIQEVIKHAAVMSDQGWIFLGKCHSDCFHQMRNVGVTAPNGSFNQGFVTNRGRFVPRNRALDIAVRANQCERVGDSLISEMLWHERDAGKFKYDSIRGYYLEEKIEVVKNTRSEKCPGCGYLYFVVARDMKATRTCIRCLKSWLPGKSKEGV